MVRKGIVVVEEGAVRNYRAVAPAELMAKLHGDFEQRRHDAEHVLDGVYAPPERDRIYQVHTPQQVFERARTMIAGAREILLFDLYPEPLALLLPAPETAAAAGIAVAGVAYGEAPRCGFPCVPTPGDRLHERWPGQQVTLIADGEEFMTALLSHDGGKVLHGIWSQSRYLACLQHSGLSS